jgi:hypothetical protein
MKTVNLSASKSWGILYTQRWLVLCLALLLSLNKVSIAYAGTSFTGYSGPVWFNALNLYRLTVQATLSTGHRSICVHCHIGTGPETTPVNCSGGPGTWSCDIPETANAQIYWTIEAYPNDTCGGAGTSIFGYSSSLSTGPSAVNLITFTAENTEESSSSLRPVLVIAAGVVLLLLAWLRGQKLRKGK